MIVLLCILCSCWGGISHLWLSQPFVCEFGCQGHQGVMTFDKMPSKHTVSELQLRHNTLWSDDTEITTYE